MNPKTETRILDVLPGTSTKAGMSAPSATEMLVAAQKGNAGAMRDLFPLLYGELRAIAHRKLQSNSLRTQFSTTELVHEAYVKLIDHDKVSWKTKTHFFALGARAMRQVLVDRARRNNAVKRGSGAPHVSFEEELLTRNDDRHVLAVEEALERLEELSPEQASIVEMRFYGGMTVEEVANELGKSKRWVEGEWTMIRAWLRAELSES